MNHVIEPVCTVLPTVESKTVYLFFTHGEKERYIRENGMEAYLKQIKRFVKQFVSPQPVTKLFGAFDKPFQE